MDYLYLLDLYLFFFLFVDFGKVGVIDDFVDQLDLNLRESFDGYFVCFIDCLFVQGSNCEIKRQMFFMGEGDVLDFFLEQILYGNKMFYILIYQLNSFKRYY